MDQAEALDQLTAELDAAKTAERMARDYRVTIEEKITDHLGGAPEEGSRSAKANIYRVSVKGSLSRRVDWEAYDQVMSSVTLPRSMLPVKEKRELDPEKLNALETSYPEIYKAIIPCITVRPLKTQVTFKRLEGNDEH